MGHMLVFDMNTCYKLFSGRDSIVFALATSLKSNSGIKYRAVVLNPWVAMPGGVCQMTLSQGSPN